MGRFGRAAAGLVAAGIVLGALPSTVSRLFGGTGSPYTALLAALVPLTVLPLAVAALLAAAAVGPWRRPDRRTAGRSLRVAAVAVPVMLLGTHATWVAPSVLPGDRTAPVSAAGLSAAGGSSGPAGLSGAASPAAGGSLRVLATNLEFGEADAAQVVDLVRSDRVDVLVVIELTPAAVDRLRAEGLDDLLPASQLAPEPGASGSGIWSRLPLTPVAEIEGTRFRHPRARLTLPDGRPVVVTAAHPSPPTQPALAVRDLGLLTAASRALAGAPQLMAGDFNATRDIAPFRDLLGTGLVDAADEVGLAAAWPDLTWPADQRVPPVMRLDHVLASPSVFTATAVRTVQVAGTDHRAVFAELAVRAG